VIRTLEPPQIMPMTLVLKSHCLTESLTSGFQICKRNYGQIIEKRSSSSIIYIYIYIGIWVRLSKVYSPMAQPSHSSHGFTTLTHKEMHILVSDLVKPYIPLIYLNSYLIIYLPSSLNHAQLNNDLLHSLSHFIFNWLSYITLQSTS